MRPRVRFGHSLVLPRRVFGLLVRELQGLAVYRRIARSLRSDIETEEADEQDMRSVHAWLNPGGQATVLDRGLAVGHQPARQEEAPDSKKAAWRECMSGRAMV